MRWFIESNFCRRFNNFGLVVADPINDAPNEIFFALWRFDFQELWDDSLPFSLRALFNVDKDTEAIPHRLLESSYHLLPVPSISIPRSDVADITVSLVRSFWKLWENSNFPQLDILENRTNEVLEAFNKCRKLELELQEDDTEIKRFNISINTLIERRAQESYKHSSYSKNVTIYMEGFSKESETVETILIILLTLLSEAKDRRESTNKLRQDY
ncbi:hypothetical protein RhiirA1_533803 [Rhizophagus irregularis]|uniref:Uncharacterized protein n=1 Tax=Rhizophagus irregularis TaxID=588596 RepID=A0A2N0S099_9GLOM|nr:hypothetical protein RhiirA1_533803 [Rhizophagus irregularis]